MADKPAKNGSVFISYSRKDKEFVRKLHESLKANDVTAWVDWEGIPLSADWMDEITRAVDGADAFLVVISPDWLESKVCLQELELGLTRNKKLIPILHRPPEKGAPMHEKLAATNWVYLRETDDHEATVPKLIEAINTDLDWVRQHTRLLQRANEWKNKNHNASFLLQGADLEDGEKWMNEATQKSEREVLPLQGEYIGASRKEALRRQRILLTGVSLAMVVSLFLAVLALFQWRAADQNKELAVRNALTAVANEHKASTQQVIAETNANIAATQESIAQTNEKLAKTNETIAKAQRNAAEAQAYQGKAAGLNTSTLLAIDSWQTKKTDEAENIIRQNVSQLPVPVNNQMSQAGYINTIHLSPDGLRFVSSSADGTACVWTIKDGHKEYCVEHEKRKGKYNPVEDAIFTPDGKGLITAGADGTVRFWNGSNGAFEKKLEFVTPVVGSVSALGTTPDGSWLAMGRSDGILTAVSLVDPSKEQLDVAVPGAVEALALSPDGQWGGIGTDTGQVEIWYVGSRYIIPGPKHDGAVYAITFSPDSKLILSGGADSKARLAKTQSGKQLYVFGHGDWVEDLAFGPDGSWFAAASDDNRLWVWDTNTHEIKIRPRHDNYAQVVKISPDRDGQWIASTGYDKTLRIWDSKSGSQMLQITLDGIGSTIAFAADGKSIIVGDRLGHLSIWDISALSARIWYIEFPELVHEAKLNSFGDLFINSDDKRVWLLKANQLLTSHSGTAIGKSILQAKNLTYNTDISQDSKWFVVAERDENRAILYNVDNTSSRFLNHGAPVIDVSFSPDNLQVATAGQDGVVTIWDVQKGTRIMDFKNPTSALFVVFSPDGTKLAVGLHDQIIIWDVAKQTQISQLAQTGDINVLSFSKDGRWLATGSSDSTIYLWDAKNLTSAQPLNIFRQTDAVLTFEFSPDLRWLAVGGADNLVHLWDLGSNSEIARIPHTDKVSSLLFSQDGKQLITVSRKIIQIWDLALVPRIPAQDLIKIACARLTKNLSNDQWKLLLGDKEPYRLICPDLPVGDN
jgi:WD40 repeat protein